MTAVAASAAPAVALFGEGESARACGYNAGMLLDRRRFLGGLPALLPAAVAPAEESPRTRFYLLERYFLEQGTEPTRIHDFFSKALLPALEKIHKGPKIFLDGLLAPHLPQVAAIFGISSIEQVWSISQALFANQEFSKAFDEWEAGEAPYQTASATLLEAAGYSPEIAAPGKPPETPRVFELRTYHSPTARQLKMLHERFSGAEIKIFHRSGVHPLFYSSTVFGDMRPNLTYLIPFDSLAAREKAWAAFGADPEWVKVRRESIERGGQLSAVQQISMYRATAYSPIR